MPYTLDPDSVATLFALAEDTIAASGPGVERLVARGFAKMKVLPRTRARQFTVTMQMLTPKGVEAVTWLRTRARRLS